MYYKVLLVIHVMTTIALILMVLVQRSSSDGMGLSGSSSSNSFMSGRAAASFATRMTAVLAAIFILTSLTLGVITARSHVENGSIADRIKTITPKSSVVTPAIPPAADKAPVTAPAAPAASVPATQTTPLAPAPVTPAAPATAPSIPRPE